METKLVKAVAISVADIISSETKMCISLSFYLKKYARFHVFISSAFAAANAAYISF